MSKKGLGAILEQQHEDQWLPVAYASRVITETQSRYASIEREALAIQLACDHFHNYIYGRPVQLETDYKPLVAIFKKVLDDCPAQLQRIQLKVQKYDLHISYISGKSMHAADALLHAAIADDIKNTDQTGLDVEAKVAAVIKYVPITGKNMNETK